MLVLRIRYPLPSPSGPHGGADQNGEHIWKMAGAIQTGPMIGIHALNLRQKSSGSGGSCDSCQLHTSRLGNMTRPSRTIRHNHHPFIPLERPDHLHGSGLRIFKCRTPDYGVSHQFAKSSQQVGIFTQAHQNIEILSTAKIKKQKKYPAVPMGENIPPGQILKIRFTCGITVVES